MVDTFVTFQLDTSISVADLHLLNVRSNELQREVSRRFNLKAMQLLKFRNNSQPMTG